MASFARVHREQYAKLVLDQLSKLEIYVCPFAKASLRLVELLFELLDVGNERMYTESVPAPSVNPQWNSCLKCHCPNTVSTQSTRYLPLFFACADAFKEVGHTLSVLCRPIAAYTHFFVVTLVCGLVDLAVIFSRHSASL